jgi:hypothetical protein
MELILFLEGLIHSEEELLLFMEGWLSSQPKQFLLKMKHSLQKREITPHNELVPSPTQLVPPRRTIPPPKHVLNY